MIDPLLDAAERARPSWKSWKAHVRLLSFCLRYSYVPTDEQLLNRLVLEFLTLFRAAYPESYSKPKHHMIEHLAKYLWWVESCIE